MRLQPAALVARQYLQSLPVIDVVTEGRSRQPPCSRTKSITSPQQCSPIAGVLAVADRQAQDLAPVTAGL